MTTPSDQALIDRFLDALWLEKGLSDNTLKAYRSDLEKSIDRRLVGWGGHDAILTPKQKSPDKPGFS